MPKLQTEQEWQTEISSTMIRTLLWNGFPLSDILEMIARYVEDVSDTKCYGKLIEDIRAIANDAYQTWDKEGN